VVVIERKVKRRKVKGREVTREKRGTQIEQLSPFHPFTQ
jgi:hypothetical protein